ncbi:MAG: biopolymer transporter ExbD [Gammaproteobacteria bacterium]|nr:biopolymer transporter ExbD [Gammaproteobacteria bacterium]
MLFRQRRLPEADEEISLTPMLDIVFILLIFFIVTTSFVKEPGIDPMRPVADTAELKERGNILIAVSRTDGIWMNKRQVRISDIEQLVEAAASEHPESSAVIIADQGAATGTIIDVMDRVRRAGVSNVSIAADASSSSG